MFVFVIGWLRWIADWWFVLSRAWFLGFRLIVVLSVFCLDDLN